MQATETIGQWLEGLTSRDSSSDEDNIRMQALLRRVGFPGAVVVLGIVYLEGEGTLGAPPTIIHEIAKMLVRKVASKR